MVPQRLHDGLGREIFRDFNNDYEMVRLHGRDLPWQHEGPLSHLVSEVMLQQTQVDRVVPKYYEFLDRYPSFEHLADAPVNDVKKTWYPLGYNIRPERLHSIARETVARYQGKLPSGAEELLSFKGIGRYTAGAIRSFAFNEDAAIVDTNVMRVLHRIFIAKGDAKTHKTKLWALSEALIPPGKGYDSTRHDGFRPTCCTARNLRAAHVHETICKTYPLRPKGRSAHDVVEVAPADLQ